MQKSFPLDFYDENLYIADNKTYTIQFTANRNELVRFNPVTGIIFPFRLEVRYLEIIALITLPVGLIIVIQEFIHLKKGRILSPLLILLLLFFYGCCAFSYRL